MTCDVSRYGWHLYDIVYKMLSSPIALYFKKMGFVA